MAHTLVQVLELVVVYTLSFFVAFVSGIGLCVLIVEHYNKIQYKKELKEYEDWCATRKSDDFK